MPPRLVIYEPFRNDIWRSLGNSANSWGTFEVLHASRKVSEIKLKLVNKEKPGILKKTYQIPPMRDS